MFVIIGTIVVLGSVIGGYLGGGGHLGVLWQPFEFVIIAGAGLGALVIGSPKTVLLATAKSLPLLIKGSRHNKKTYLELLSLLYSIFKLAKTKGDLALESHVERPDESPLFAKFPNFSKDPLALSGITLTSSTARNTVTVWPSAKPLDGILPGPFTAAREFNADETVTLYAEVYENGKRAPHTVNFKVELRSSDGKVISRYDDQRSVDANGTGILGFVAPVRLLNTAPGDYSIRVEAQSSATKTPVMRELPIRVR